MQTFLPLPSFKESAQALDRQRLQKQLVETLQIMKAVTDPTYGWQHHPAVNQWRGYEAALLMYQKACCDEFRRRGYTTDLDDKTQRVFEEFVLAGVSRHDIPSLFEPWYIGVPKYHESHRSNLLRKEHEALAKKPETTQVWYGELLWDEPDDLEYWWPSKQQEDRPLLMSVRSMLGWEPVNRDLGLILEEAS
jgi:hypothetical protein